MSGLFLEDEMRTHESLYNYFGGGYEVATLGHRGFAKLDDLTYMFWDAEVNGEQVKIKTAQSFQIPILWRHVGDTYFISQGSWRGI